MWSSKESLWSNLTPNSLSLLLLVTSKFLFWQYYALSSVKIRQACSKVLLSINYFNRRLWNTFKNTFWWSSLLSNTSARRECDTSATRVWHEWDTSDTIAAQVLQKRHECDTGEKPLLKVTIWQVTDYKEKNNFILKTTFWKCLVPTPKCVWKVHHKIELFNGKTYIKELYTR